MQNVLASGPTLHAPAHCHPRRQAHPSLRRLQPRYRHSRSRSCAGAGVVTPTELAQRWRGDAETLDRYEPNLARVCRDHADALDSAMRSVADDALDLATAARESGYSRDRLRHLVSAGEIPNAGKLGAPRIRRGDLPSKGSRLKAS